MIRVVLDTNVLVSGTFWAGASARIIKLIERGKLGLVLSREILEEYDAVMEYDEIKRKVSYHHERAQAALKLAQLGLIVSPAVRVQAVREDPSDDKFLEAAIAGKASCIVSPANHLLKLGRYRDIPILTPDDFLKSLPHEMTRGK
jgi:hypothetical protein